MANIRRMARDLREARNEMAKMAAMLEACHEANLLRSQVLKDAGIPDPVNGGEEE